MQARDARSRSQDLTRPWHIYALADPRFPSEVRYIGWTTDPKRRLKTHIRDAKSGKDKTLCGNWKRGVLADGITPEMQLLESGQGLGHDSAETRWVAYYKDAGAQLTNMTRGGGGTSGRVVPQVVRDRIGAAHRGRKHTITAKHNMSLAHIGKRHKPEQTAKIVTALRGRKITDGERQQRCGRKASAEAVQKSADARRGQRRSDTSREKMSAAHRGVPLTPAHVAAVAAAHVGLVPSESTKAKIQASLKEHYRVCGGRKHSEETKAKIAAGVKARRASLDVAVDGQKLTCTLNMKEVEVKI